MAYGEEDIKKIQEKEDKAVAREKLFRNETLVRTIGLIAIFGFAITLMILINLSRDSTGIERDIFYAIIFGVIFLLIWSIAGSLWYRMKKKEEKEVNVNRLLNQIRK